MQVFAATPALLLALTHFPLQVITVDAHGISGHTNHRAVHAGVLRIAQAASAVSAARSPPMPACYALETVAIPRKFSSALDLAASAFATWWRNRAHYERAAIKSGSVGDAARIAAHPPAVFAAHLGAALSDAVMRAHASQYVWFRKFFVCCSRHTFVNTLVRMGVGAARASATNGDRSTTSAYTALPGEGGPECTSSQRSVLYQAGAPAGVHRRNGGLQ